MVHKLHNIYMYMTGIEVFDFETILEGVFLRVFDAFNDFSFDESQVAELRFCHKNFFDWPRQKMTCWLFDVNNDDRSHCSTRGALTPDIGALMFC